MNHLLRDFSAERKKHTCSVIPTAHFWRLAGSSVATAEVCLLLRSTTTWWNLWLNFASEATDLVQCCNCCEWAVDVFLHLEFVVEFCIGSHSSSQHSWWFSRTMKYTIKNSPCRWCWLNVITGMCAVEFTSTYSCLFFKGDRGTKAHRQKWDGTKGMQLASSASASARSASASPSKSLDALITEDARSSQQWEGGRAGTGEDENHLNWVF